MSELPEGYVHIVDANGAILQSYDFDLVWEDGLPNYSWPDGSKIVHKPSPAQIIQQKQKMYPPVGPVKYV